MARYAAAYSEIRKLLGKPEEPRIAADKEVVTFQLLDVVVNDAFSSVEAAVPNTLKNKAEADLAPPPENLWSTPLHATLFGTTQQGESVAIHVNGFTLSCHCTGPKQHLEAFASQLQSKGYKTTMTKYPNFYGFKYDPVSKDRVKNNYLKITTNKLKKYNQLKFMTPSNVKLVEYDGIPLYTKFFDSTKLKPFDWLDVQVEGDLNYVTTTADIEGQTLPRLCKVRTDLVMPAPFLLASADIETYSGSGGFPNYLSSSDAVICACLAFQRFGSKDTTLVSLALNPDMKGSDIGKLQVLQARDGPMHTLFYNNEVALIEGFRDLVCVYADVDVVMWYNGFRFDLNYMGYRVLRQTISQESCQRSKFYQFSKFVRTCTPLKSKRLQSSGMGDNELFTFDKEYGRITIDLYQIITLREKLSSYSLDNVCKTILTVAGGTIAWQPQSDQVEGKDTTFTKMKVGDSVQVGEYFYPIKAIHNDTQLTLGKVPEDDKAVTGARFIGQVTKINMSFTDMFADYLKRDYQDMLDYCVRDCVAPLLILNKQKYFLNDIEMCRATNTTVQQLHARGQGIRGINLMVQFAHQQGFLLDVPSERVAYEYQGATVVEPQKGFHTDPVVTLDFMSLYPSIMISRWMCWSTIVLDEQEGFHPDIEYLEIPLPPLPGQTESRLVKFAQRRKGDTDKLKCMLPELELFLLAYRKSVKKEMGAAYGAKNYDLGDLLNAKQLAIKIVCNSMYGLTGAGTSILCLMTIAECITAYGRQTLEKTKVLAVQYLKDKHGVDSEIIYGDTDSVMVKMYINNMLPEGHSQVEKATKAWDIGMDTSKAVTNLLGNGIILECEKVYQPYLLVMKKTYAGIKYEGPPPFRPYREVKGLEMIKRDTSQFIKRTQAKIVDTMLETGDEAAALPIVKDLMTRITFNKIPVEEFVISKKIGKEYKGKTLPVAVQVNNRKHDRAPGSEYKPGERVPMVAVERRGKTGPLLEKCAVSEMMDDPEYVKQQGWKPNRKYYLTEFRKKVARVLPNNQETVASMIDECISKINAEKFRSPFNTEAMFISRLDKCISQGGNKKPKSVMKI